MRALFIGGTGNISSACVELALRSGWQVILLNRGHASIPEHPALSVIYGDRNDPATLRQAAALNPDVVADFIGYNISHIELDLQAFAGHTGQYIFISSASAYQKPLPHYIVTEETPLANPYWQYARDKIACEERLMQAWRDAQFPVTIVRPSYTYGPSWIPSGVGGHGYTIVHRLRSGLPIISHGDGQSLWVMTHTSDFAVGFCGLMGNSRTLGEAFHITSDEALTWDVIYQQMAEAAGCQAQLVHISSDTIAAAYPDWGAGLLGDKMHTIVFDNAKIKRYVPAYHAAVSWAEGIARSIAWHDADPVRQQLNPETNRRMDDLIARYRSI